MRYLARRTVALTISFYALDFLGMTILFVTMEGHDLCHLVRHNPSQGKCSREQRRPLLFHMAAFWLAQVRDTLL
jgi:hypothetical protein